MLKVALSLSSVSVPGPPRADIGGRDNEARLRVEQPDGQVRPPPRQVNTTVAVFGV